MLGIEEGLDYLENIVAIHDYCVPTKRLITSSIDFHIVAQSSRLTLTKSGGKGRGGERRGGERRGEERRGGERRGEEGR